MNKKYLLIIPSAGGTDSNQVNVECQMLELCGRVRTGEGLEKNTGREDLRLEQRPEGSEEGCVLPRMQKVTGRVIFLGQRPSSVCDPLV